MGLIRKSDGSTSDLIDKWYPTGYKSELQATPIGLTAEVIDSLTGGIDPDFAALQARVTVLEQKLATLETEFGLHDNNGKHWTGAEIDGRAQAIVDTHNSDAPHKSDADINGLIDTKVTEHTDAYTHTPV